jgi:hypothetical protein
VTTEAKVKTDMNTVERLKEEAATRAAKASWRENGHRLIWCGRNEDGSFTFRNTVSATSRGPKIGETESARLLAEEGPWLRPTLHP